MNQPNHPPHLLVDAGGTKTAFAWLYDGKLFRCQGAGINANYTPEADILRILAEAAPQFPKEATIRGIDYYGAGCATPQNAMRMESYLRMFFPTVGRWLDAHPPSAGCWATKAAAPTSANN